MRYRNVDTRIAYKTQPNSGRAMHFRKEDVSLAVTEVPTPEQFHTVTQEGAERASQPLPGDGLPTAAQESSRLLASHSQASQSITFCCHLTCYFGRKSTAPLMGSISAVHRGKGPAFPQHPGKEEKGRALRNPATTAGFHSESSASTRPEHSSNQQH